MPVTHVFVSPAAPTVDPTLVGSTQWNQAHTVSIVNADVNPAAAIVESKLALNFPTHAAVTIGAPANGLSVLGQVLSLGLASSGVTGALSGTDWDTFNNKQAALAFPLVANLGGTGVANAAGSTLTLGGAVTISTGGTIALGGFTLTVPATGIAALLGVSNVFTVGGQMVDNTADTIELRLQAHSTKTTSMATHESSLGTVLSGINSAGKYFTGLTGTVLAEYQTTYANIGVASPNTAYGYYASINNFNTGNLVGAKISVITLKDSPGTVSLVQGLEFQANCGAGAITNVTNMYGVLGSINHTGTSGTISDAYCSNVGASNSSPAGIITRLYGYYYKKYAGAGTITNEYGIYLEDVNRGATLSYAIYTNLGISRLGDQLSVIGAVDRPQLQVTGFTTQTLPPVYFVDNTAATNVVRNVLQIETQSTGAVAAGLGAGFLFTIETATAGTMQAAGLISASWIDATNATRKAKLSLSAYDTAIRLGMEIEASGAAAKLAFYGGTTVVRGAALTAADAGVVNSGDATTDGVINNMRTRINELEARLGSASGVNLFA